MVIPDAKQQGSTLPNNLPDQRRAAAVDPYRDRGLWRPLVAAAPSPDLQPRQLTGHIAWVAWLGLL